MAVRVLRNFRWACEVFPRLCTSGWNGGYCLSVANDCCCCAVVVAEPELGFGLFGRKSGKEGKQTTPPPPLKKKTNGNWRCGPRAGSRRGGGSSAARATPDPLLTVECFSSLRSQKFSMESGLLHECVLRPQRSRKWSRQNKIKTILNTHTRARARKTVMEPATINMSLHPHPRPACILELTVGNESTKGGEALRGPCRYGNMGAETLTTEASICLKGPLLDYHRVRTRYHRCSRLHGTPNITVHQLSRSLTCNNKTHTHTHVCTHALWLNIHKNHCKSLKNVYDMNYSLDKKEKREKNQANVT